MAMFEVINNQNGQIALRPALEDLPDYEHPYYAEHTFWVIDDEGFLCIVNGKTNTVYNPPAGKYTIRYTANKRETWLAQNNIKH